MKKIILVEDRPDRKKNLLGTEIDNKLDEISALKIVQDKPSCENIIDHINSENFSIFDEYQLIMIHKSSLSQTGLKNLGEYCKSNKVDLIFFSGGLSQAIYHSDSHQFLSLNSKDFYSLSLEQFLIKYAKNTETTNLNELLLGNNYKLAKLLQYRLVDTFIKKMNGIPIVTGNPNDEQTANIKITENLNLGKEIVSNIDAEINDLFEKL